MELKFEIHIPLVVCLLGDHNVAECFVGVSRRLAEAEIYQVVAERCCVFEHT